MQLEGETIQWHISFMRYRQYVQAISWKEYVGTLVEIFEINFDDPMEEIKKIKQTKSMREYQVTFEISLTRVNLSGENAISCDIGGLKTKLNITVKITKPSFLYQTYKNARMQKIYLLAMRQHFTNYFQVNARKFADQKHSSGKGILPTPSSTTSKFSKGVNMRTLSIEKINDKKAMELCYFCNDKYMSGHKWKNLKYLYLLEVDESKELDDLQIERDGEVQEEQDDQLELGQPVEHMKISMHALNGSLGFRTLKVTGYH